VNQPKKNNSIVAAIAAFMAIILLAFGAYLQVPILEGLTHDAHHTQKEIYAFAAEIEESVEEDRSAFAFGMVHYPDLSKTIIRLYLRSIGKSTSCSAFFLHNCRSLCCLERKVQFRHVGACRT
jgi:hypothetical protein